MVIKTLFEVKLVCATLPKVCHKSNVHGWHWPHSSSRLIHRICSKLFFLWLVVRKGSIWDQFCQIRSIWNLYPCTRVSKSLLTCDLFWHVSRKQNFWQVLSCCHCCFLWCKEQFDMLLYIIWAFWKSALTIYSAGSERGSIDQSSNSFHQIIPLPEPIDNWVRERINQSINPINQSHRWDPSLNLSMVEPERRVVKINQSIYSTDLSCSGVHNTGSHSHKYFSQSWTHYFAFSL